ncbi:GMC family oxidoreductase [Sorangium sp. So ce388]|uniref:GMC family oxidoreductase n=1 Tax=Sorangium sp. So ce388 TaxID=3133309 RepID=UPI003F5C119C
MTSETIYDVVIVGAGVCGAILASKLAAGGKQVLLLDAGEPVPGDRSEYMDSFYLARAKTPESPYPTTERRAPEPLFPLQDPAQLAAPRPTILQLGKWRDPKQSYLVQPQTPESPAPDAKGALRKMPFSSTYERVGGGTIWHWLGTSLRHVPNDLKMYSTYGKDVPGSPFGPWADWPIEYAELQQLYGQAEAEIGVSASVKEQAPLKEAIGLAYPEGYEYPMQAIPVSMVDQALIEGLGRFSVPSGVPEDPSAYDVFVTPTPAGRNSQPYQGRRVCAGNTNCIPICPIQAKWDSTVSLNNALDTGNVTVIYRAVACNVDVDSKGDVAGIDYLVYTKAASPPPPQRATARGRAYVLAAHAIENAKLLLMSNGGKGVANSSRQVGRNLMDHVLYLTWGLLPETKSPIFGYRGPLTTAGIESLRDGAFRKHRCAFRIEIGNEGWNFPKGDPYSTMSDFVLGTNTGGLNKSGERLAGVELALRLNSLLTRQFRMAFLMEQSPQAANQVVLDYTNVDGLGLPRPKIIDYGLDEYTLNGFRAARIIADEIYDKIGAQQLTDFGPPEKNHDTPGYFLLDEKPCRYYGAGHVVGTHRMGTDKDSAVVDASQRSFDHPNLWIVGSGSFPTIATANPTLTLAALTFKTADSILRTLA